MKRRILRTMIGRALAGLIYGMVGSVSGMALAIGFGTPWAWALSRLWVGGFIGCLGRASGLLAGIIGAFVARIFSHLTGLELSWVNWLILGAFIGMARGIEKKSLRLLVLGVIAGGVGGLLGGWIYLARPGGTAVDMEYIALVGLGWAILGALIGLSHQGLIEKSRRKIICGIIVGAISGVVAMFLWGMVIDYIANLVGLWGPVLMEGSIAGMSIWVFITFVSIIVKKENVSD